MLPGVAGDLYHAHVHPGVDTLPGAFGVFRQRQLPVENSSSVQCLRLRTSPSVRARPLPRRLPAYRQSSRLHADPLRAVHRAAAGHHCGDWQFPQRIPGGPPSASNPCHRRRKRPLSSPWSCHRWTHRAGGNPATRSGQAQQRGGQRTADGKDQTRVACTECGDLLLPLCQRPCLRKATSQVVAALKDDIVAIGTDNFIREHVYPVVPAGFPRR